MNIDKIAAKIALEQNIANKIASGGALKFSIKSGDMDAMWDYARQFINKYDCSDEEESGEIDFVNLDDADEVFKKVKHDPEAKKLGITCEWA